MDRPPPEAPEALTRALIEASAREQWGLLPTGPDDEHWWAVDGVYWVSTLGRVLAIARSHRAPGNRLALKSLRVERRDAGRRPHTRTNLRVKLEVRKSGSSADRPVRVHRLVAAVWQSRLGGELVRHLNGDGCDNRVANLLRGTASQNLLDQYALGERGRPEDQEECLPLYEIDPEVGF